MANEFECLDTLTTPSSSQGYVCAGNLPVTNVSNYYIKCQDQPWLVGTANESSRNTMMQSHIYSVKKPSSKISIFETSPDRDIVVTTAQASVTLDVTTAGGAQYHACEYSFSGYDSMIPFFETQFNTKHTQLFNLNAGQKKIYVECSDETGDFARGEANFEIIQETTAPQVTRAWQVGSSLHITTDEEAVCKYTEDQGTFVWSGAVALGGDGFEHRIEAVRGATYYVKCQDMLGNYPASGYSIILSAS
jgi:hypothetical protein